MTLQILKRTCINKDNNSNNNTDTVVTATAATTTKATPFFFSSIRIDAIENSSTFSDLVRYDVAPDHPEVTYVQNEFAIFFIKKPNQNATTRKKNEQQQQALVEKEIFRIKETTKRRGEYSL